MGVHCHPYGLWSPRPSCPSVSPPLPQPRPGELGTTGPSLAVSPLQESLFPARVVYDLLFFFIVIIIVLNLIFGVIIDTFADLRSEKQKKEEILKTTCFICGEACFLLRCCTAGGLGAGLSSEAGGSLSSTFPAATGELATGRMA